MTSYLSGAKTNQFNALVNKWHKKMTQEISSQKLFTTVFYNGNYNCNGTII